MKKDPSYSSAELVTLLKQHNRDAYEHLIDKYAGALLDLVSNIIDNKDETLPTLEKAFLAIVQSIGNYDPQKSSVFTWMLQLTRNIALQKRKELIQQPAVTSRTGIGHLIGKLDYEQKEIVQLLYLNGYSNEDIASKMNISTTSAAQKIKMALSNLNSLL